MHTAPSAITQYRVRLVAYGALVFTAFLVLRPFLIPAAWAAILAYVTWPLFVRLDRALGGHTSLAALIMTMAIVLGVLIPASLLSLALASEVQRFLAEGGVPVGGLLERVAALVERVPVLGSLGAQRLRGLWADPSEAQQWVLHRLGVLVGALGSAAGDAGRLAGEALLTLLTLFFVFREGGGLGAQITRVLERFGGVPLRGMLKPLGETVRAVTYGTLLTALVQGVLVGLGSWAVGLRGPVLLGALTGLLALTPIGGPVVYGPAGLSLLFQGRWVAGVLFLAWGILVVSTVDNVIRSWFISGAVRMPFLLGLFGVLGGVLAFGTLGLFVGPVAVGLILTLWREWATEGGSVVGV
jgi:predicted PurR-regulated permease PerM